MDKKNLGADSIVIQWRIKEWFPQLSADIQTKLRTYFDTMHKFNKSINLVSVKTLPLSDALHFSDSIIACQEIIKKYKISELYDIGSGNGFPGVIYAILSPSTKLKLVESDQRKVEFLKTLVSELKLSNVEVLFKNAESLPDNSIEFAITRGFAGIPKSILMLRKQFKVGGKFFHLKGEEWATEVASIPSQLCSFWTPALVSEYKLPIGNIKFAVVATDRIGQ